MRRPRYKPEQQKTFYHAMCRTAQGRNLFDDSLKAEAVEIIKTYAEIYYVELFSYTIMSNHLHLALKITQPAVDKKDLKRRFQKMQKHIKYKRCWHDERVARTYERLTDLSEFMKEILVRIAKLHNKKQETMGHFWGDRFKSIVIEDETSLQRVIEYIECNPVRAGMVEKPSEYPWCDVGATKAGLDAGEVVEAPMMGLYSKIKDRVERCQAYIDVMDYAAYLIRHPEGRIDLPPPEIARLSITGDEWVDIRDELLSRRASNWSKAGYGSEDFVKKSQKKAREGIPPP